MQLLEKPVDISILLYDSLNFERLLEKPVGLGILLYRFASFFFIGVSLPLGSLGGNHHGVGFIGSRRY